MSQRCEIILLYNSRDKIGENYTEMSHKSVLFGIILVACLIKNSHFNAMRLVPMRVGRSCFVAIAGLSGLDRAKLLRRCTWILASSAADVVSFRARLLVAS